MIKNKILKNASWIIGCRLVQAILNLVISMITARYLGPSNYGVISYAMSVVAFFVPIMNLGISDILVNEIISDEEHDNTVLGTAIVMTLISGIFSMLGANLFVAIFNSGEKDTIIVCFLYSFVLVFQALETIQYWFQAKYLSKYTSITMLVAYILVSIYKVVLLVSQKSIYWFAIVNALDYFIIAVSLLVLYRKISGKRLKVSLSCAKKLFANGRHYIVSSMMVTIFAQTDRIMLKLMIDEASVGYYSAAVTICGMTGFVFVAIINSMRPAICENKLKDQNLYELYVKRLYCIIIYFALIQSAGIALFSELIVDILYGSQYYPMIGALRVIVWYTTFSYLGAVRNVWILAENKQKYLWIINLSGAIMNVVLNFILIPFLGIVGASVASLITQIFTNVIIGFIIKPIRENNKLMISSLNIFKLLRFKDK